MTQYKLFGGFMRPRDPDEDIDGGCGHCVAKPIESTRITYDGPNLPCTGVHTCDDFTKVLQKIDVQICDIKTELFNLTSTTTTTTTQLP